MSENTTPTPVEIVNAVDKEANRIAVKMMCKSLSVQLAVAIVAGVAIELVTRKLNQDN